MQKVDRAVDRYGASAVAKYFRQDMTVRADPTAAMRDVEQN